MTNIRNATGGGEGGWDGRRGREYFQMTKHIASTVDLVKKNTFLKSLKTIFLNTLGEKLCRNNEL